MSRTPPRRGTFDTPSTPPPRRLSSLSGTGRRHRSDSNAAQALMSSAPTTPPGSGFPHEDIDEKRGNRHGRSGSVGTTPRPVSTFLETEQDMADLTAEMALLDDGVDSRSGRTMTGGLRPLSLLQSHFPRPSSASDDPEDRRLSTSTRGRRSSSYSAHATFYNTSGAALSTATFSHLDKDINRIKKNALFSMFLYRLRFILRLLSLIGAGCVLVVIAHLTLVYNRTKSLSDWPAGGIDVGPTNMLMAGAIVCIVMDLTWTIGGINVGVRRLDSGVRSWVKWVAAISSLVVVAIWVLAIVYTAKVKRLGGKGGMNTLFYACQTTVDTGAVDFVNHCTEIKSGWFAAISVAGVNVVIFLTIVLGMMQSCLASRRKGKERAYDEEKGRRWPWRRR